MESQTDSDAAHDRRSTLDLGVIGLAYAGGVIAYVPLLTLLLPDKISAIVGPEARLDVLGACTLLGALAASLANVMAGALSDRTARTRFGRRGWMVVGLAIVLTAYAGLEGARSAPLIIAWLVVFQAGVNFLLAPLIAVLAEEVPTVQRGVLGGVLGVGYPFGALFGIAATAPAVADAGLGLALTGTAVALLIAPFILMRRPPLLESAPPALARPRILSPDFTKAAVSRLLLQVAGAAVFVYLVYYFESLTEEGGGGPAAVTSRLAWLCAIVTLASAPLALGVGKALDRFGRARGWLAACAVLCAAGLAAMGFGHDVGLAVVGYAVFGCSIAVFMAIHTAWAMDLLPSPAHRGRDLGLLNLANTAPSIIAPLLAYGLVRGDDFAPLLLVLAGLCLASGALIVSIGGGRRGADSPARLDPAGDVETSAVQGRTP